MIAVGIGIIILLLGLWKVIYIVRYIVKNKGDISKQLLDTCNKKYTVIDIRKYNKLMLTQDIALIILCTVIGILAITSRNMQIFGPTAFILGCVNLIFNSNKNKYIEKKY